MNKTNYFTKKKNYKTLASSSENDNKKRSSSQYKLYSFNITGSGGTFMSLKL